MKRNLTDALLAEMVEAAAHGFAVHPDCIIVGDEAQRPGFRESGQNFFKSVAGAGSQKCVIFTALQGLTAGGLFRGGFAPFAHQAND